MIYVIYITVALFIIVFAWISYQKSLKEAYIPSFRVRPHKLTPSILTYNIQKFPWSFKTFKHVIELFDRHSIILLQECYDETFTSLESYFPHYYICRGTLKGINLINSGLAIMSKYPILSHQFVPYANYNPLTFDRLTEKGFLLASLDLGTQIISVVNTHMQSCDFERYDYYAFLQLRELLDHTQGLSETYIIGGDFNIDITDLKKRHYILGEGVGLHHPTESTIYSNFKTSYSRSSPANGYDGLIFDYFITGGTVSLNPVTIQSDYSDHNPVSSTIELS